MKTAKTAAELRAMILAELAEHYPLPAGFDITVIPDGASFRAAAAADPEHAEYGELIAKAVEISDQLSHSFQLA